eukprot:3703726-Rhodomonas_salina.4
MGNASSRVALAPADANPFSARAASGSATRDVSTVQRSHVAVNLWWQTIRTGGLPGSAIATSSLSAFPSPAGSCSKLSTTSSPYAGPHACQRKRAAPAAPDSTKPTDTHDLFLQFGRAMWLLALNFALEITRESL